MKMICAPLLILACAFLMPACKTGSSIDYAKACSVTRTGMDIAGNYERLFAADPQTAPIAMQIHQALVSFEPAAISICDAAQAEKPPDDLSVVIKAAFASAQASLMMISDPQKRAIALTTLESVHVGLVVAGVLK